MTNEEYMATQTALLTVGTMVDYCDLETFLQRISTADSIGAVLDPTLYRAAAVRLAGIRELAEIAVALKFAFQKVKQAAMTVEARKATTG